MEYKEYINPELLILIPVLYVLGMMIKSSKGIKDKFIPAILGVCGVICSMIWIFGTDGISLIAAFTAFTQGVLVAGAAVYTNQIVKQARKED